MPRRAHHAFWPKRIPQRIDAPVGSLWNNLATSALRYPNKAALHYFDNTITYAQLLQKAEHLAQHLCRLGAKRVKKLSWGYKTARNSSLRTLPSCDSIAWSSP
jgi:fatty-acyl-CoA synthase